MRVPQVSERIKEAPVQALRGVLSGIGQVLLFTDRLAEQEADSGRRRPDGLLGLPLRIPRPPGFVRPPRRLRRRSGRLRPRPAWHRHRPRPWQWPKSERRSGGAKPRPSQRPGGTRRPRHAAPREVPRRKPRKPRDLNKTGNVRIITERGRAVPRAAEAEADARRRPPMPTYADLSDASIAPATRNPPPPDSARRRRPTRPPSAPGRISWRPTGRALRGRAPDGRCHRCRKLHMRRSPP